MIGLSFPTILQLATSSWSCRKLFLTKIFYKNILDIWTVDSRQTWDRESETRDQDWENDHVLHDTVTNWINLRNFYLLLLLLVITADCILNLNKHECSEISWHKSPNTRIVILEFHFLNDLTCFQPINSSLDCCLVLCCFYSGFISFLEKILNIAFEILILFIQPDSLDKLLGTCLQSRNMYFLFLDRKMYFLSV